MILWFKYRGHPFDTEVAMKISKARGSLLWTWIQSGDYELWKMGKDNRWLITSDDLEKTDNDYVVPKSREEVKIWLDINHLKIGRRIGFSECMYSYSLGSNMSARFWNHLWVGYNLIESTNLA